MRSYEYDRAEEILKLATEFGSPYSAAKLGYINLRGLNSSQIPNYALSAAYYFIALKFIITIPNAEWNVNLILEIIEDLTQLYRFHFNYKRDLLIWKHGIKVMKFIDNNLRDLTLMSKEIQKIKALRIHIAFCIALTAEIEGKITGDYKEAVNCYHKCEKVGPCELKVADKLVKKAHTKFRLLEPRVPRVQPICTSCKFEAKDLKSIWNLLVCSKCQVVACCICKFWNELAIPILWRDPFYNLHNHKKITHLLDVYLFNFTLKELKNSNLPTKLIEDYNNKKSSKYNYAEFLRRLNLTQIRTATSFWIKNKKYKDIYKDIINPKDCQIFQSFSEISLTNLSKFSCYGEPYNINLYESASKISTKIQDLKIILFYGCPINPSTLINISNFIRSQHQIKEFFIDNRIGCDCCTHDLSLALDLTIIFKSLNTQISTLSRINFISIDFHNKFPFDQLSKCENLLELNIKGCWNFGDINLIDLNYNYNNSSFKNLSDLQIIKSSIPEILIKILLIQSGKSLKNLKFEQTYLEEIFTEILIYCIENNPNLVNVLIYIDSKEIQYLPKFLRSSTKLNKLEIWDKSMRRKEMELLEIINLDDELFSDIGESLPIKLKDLTINMKWNFSIKSFENFIKNCKAPLDILSFEFCLKGHNSGKSSGSSAGSGSSGP
ncbi:11623_t:CDS:2 [Rhizophagus irregularis]|nr:11623_t:CDS:2 [Rhizophagus irregularis]